MASILSLIAGLVVGVIAGWLLRGRQIARTQSTEAHVPAQSTGSAVAAETAEDTEKAPALVGAKSAEAHASAEAPAVIAEPVAAKHAAAEPVVAEPVTPEPVAAEPVAAKHAADEPIAIAEPAVAEPVATEPVVSEPVVSEPVVSEPVVSEPVGAERAEFEPAAAEPVATEPLPAIAEPEPVPAELVETDVVVVQTIAEPDDLTKIAGIGPKMAMALAASGITTFEQLAATPLPAIRAAVTAAGMRLAPSAPTWPEQAKALARITG